MSTLHTSFVSPVRVAYRQHRHRVRCCTSPTWNACYAKPRKRVMTLQLFCQRLASVQDRKWVHKLSGSVCILSTAGVILCAPFMYLTTNHFHLPPTSIIVPLVVAWSASVSLLSVSGTVLAIRHRPTQPSERTLFIASGFSNLMSALIAVTSLPIQHPLIDALTGTIVSTCIASAFFIADPNTVDKRRKRRRKPPRSISSNGYPIHLLPFCSGIPFLLLASSTGIFFDQAAFLAMLAIKPNVLPALLYGDIINGLCAGLGAFTVTMKHRKVLSKRNEQGIIAASSSISIGTFMGFLFTTL